MSEPRGEPAHPRDGDSPGGGSPVRGLPGENGVIWTLWLTYGAFYFCRTNISAAVPALKSSLAEGGMGLSGAEVGWILAALKIAYALGQLVNGQLSERISPRVMLALGMFGSAAFNVLFGLGAGFYFLLFVWAMNGFCQSLGWTPCIRVTANWIPVERRGKAIGIIGTGYQITLGLTYLIAGYSAKELGWQGALYVPAALLALAGLFMLVCLRETPADGATSDGAATGDNGAAGDAARGDERGTLHGEDDVATSPSSKTPKAPRISFSESLYWTLYNPALWLLGLSLGLLNACRYGFLDWGLAHLMETQQVRVDNAALKFFVIAIGAAAGSYLAGWMTDRFFGSRRAPMICMLMALLGCLCLVYDSVVRHSPAGTMFLLVVIGFCIYGPQVLLVGTAPADLAHRGTSAAAAGFVNFMGYMGAATGDVVTGYFSAEEHGGWQTAIYIWAGWAFGGAVVTALLWNATSRKIGVLSGLVPQVGAVALLATAAVAVVYGQQPEALQWATGAAAVLLAITLFNRWVAAGCLLVSAAGLVVVFASYIRMNDGVTWDQTAAMLCYGLTMIASLMILVEKKVEKQVEPCE